MAAVDAPDVPGEWHLFFAAVELWGIDAAVQLLDTMAYAMPGGAGASDHKPTRFQCNFCSRLYGTSDAVRKHCRKMHPSLLSPPGQPFRYCTPVENGR